MIKQNSSKDILKLEANHTKKTQQDFGDSDRDSERIFLNLTMTIYNKRVQTAFIPLRIKQGKNHLKTSFKLMGLSRGERGGEFTETAAYARQRNRPYCQHAHCMRILQIALRINTVHILLEGEFYVCREIITVTTFLLAQ